MHFRFGQIWSFCLWFFCIYNWDGWCLSDSLPFLSVYWHNNPHRIFKEHRQNLYIFFFSFIEHCVWQDGRAISQVSTGKWMSIVFRHHFKHSWQLFSCCGKFLKFVKFKQQFSLPTPSPCLSFLYLCAANVIYKHEPIMSSDLNFGIRNCCRHFWVLLFCLAFFFFCNSSFSFWAFFHYKVTSLF